MKTTDHFKRTIQDYLEQLAAGDELFAPVYAKPNKNIDDCITYILHSVQKSGCNGFTDDEIFSMALHYYDEDNINVGSPVNCQVVVNHTVQLTEEEKEQARQNALKRAHDEAYSRVTRQTKRKPDTKQPEVNQLTLF